MADELLDYYSPEQLRMHFLSLGLSSKSVGFKPQVYLPENEREGVDPVLKDGNLLTNVYNRLIRSCFYSSQQYFDGVIPQGEVDEKIKNICKDAILEFERHMYNHEFHRVTYVLDSLIRDINKHWANNIRMADKNDDNELRRQILVDCFYGVRVIAALVHPIAPKGCEMVQEYLNVGEKFFDWNYIFDDVLSLVDDPENHKLKFLEPKVDFFAKPACQFEQN
jgi:methionyl-tRNA synthetase